MRQAHVDERPSWLHATSILPSQLLDGPAAALGERRLLARILEDASKCILGLLRVEKRHDGNDLAWLMSDDEWEPFSFVAACDTLGIDAPSYRLQMLLLLVQPRGVRARRFRAMLRNRARPFENDEDALG